MDRLAPEASGGDGVTSAVDAPESSPLDTVRSSSRLMPPSEVREALLNRLDATAPPGRGARRRRAWLTWLVVTAVVTITAAALTGMYVAGRYEAKLGQMARETASARERLRASEAMLRQHAALSGLLMDLLRDPATNVIALRGPSAQDAASSGRSNGSATGRVVWNATRGGVVAVTNLPLVPEGKVYELWAVTAATPRRVALFDVDAAGHGQQQIAAPALGVAVDSFMVTLEAAGGGVAPAGATVLTSR